MTMNTDKWTVSKARTVFAQLTKIANEQLEVAAAPEDDIHNRSVGCMDLVVQIHPKRRKRTRPSFSFLLSFRESGRP